MMRLNMQIFTKRVQQTSGRLRGPAIFAAALLWLQRTMLSFPNKGA